MTRFLIDADSAIYAMSGDFEIMRQRITSYEPGEIGLSVVSYAEIAHGTYVGKPPRSEILEAFVCAIPIVPFDEPAAREYARLSFKRARFDRLLAAHALSIGAVVVTNNEADFADVAGLVVENWTV